MSQNEAILYIVITLVTAICGSGGVFALIKFLRNNKVSDKEWVGQLNLVAILLENGVPLPNEIIIGVIRREFTASKFARSIKVATGMDVKTLKKEIKKRGK